MTRFDSWRGAAVTAVALFAVAAGPAEDPRLWRHRTLGRALFENPATVKQSVAELRLAVELAPASAADRLNYGIALLRAGGTRAAIPELETAERQAPKAPHAWFNLGLAYKRMGRHLDAVQQFEWLVRLSPGEPKTHFQLGLLYNLTGRPALALEQFQTAAGLDDRLTAPLYQIYDFYRLAGKEAEAARALTNFLSAKEALEAAGESEDMEWCAYAELYDPADISMPDGGRGREKEKFTRRALSGPVDAATAGLAVIDAFGEGNTDLLAWSRRGVRLYRQGRRLVSDSGLDKLRDVRFIAPGDFDNDGLPDICVITGAGPGLYRNLRGRFERVAAALPAGSFASAVWLDFDHDYDLDLVLLGEHSTLLRNEGGLRFGDQTRCFPFVSGRAVAGNLMRTEPDTRALDLAVLYADRAGVLYRDRLRGRFHAAPLDETQARMRGTTAADIEKRTGIALPAAWAEGDFNGHGRADLAVVARNGGLWLLANETAARGHWLAISLAGVKNLKTAPAAEVEVKAAGRYQERMYAGVPLLFDLGSAAVADVVRVTWPNGLIQNQIDVPGDQRLLVKEAPRLAGSCPMVFTWNGSGFQFIGDVLGVAPLGVSAGEDTYFPVDSHEYLRIPPGALQARDGFFDIRVTEELHEVSYIDQVRLVAVDHPAGIGIVTNDKFKAPPFPEFRLFGVERRIDPVGARDERGRNLLPALLAEDHKYAGGFPRDGRGVAAMHRLELDFPADAARDNRAVLVLNGWIDWADGSTFVAASQTGAALTLPSLETKGDDGEWRTVVADMGVPSGGPKTIAVDLTGKFSGRSRQIRISTNTCTYWDRIFLSEDTAAPQVRITRLEAAAAVLALRGFSAATVDPLHERPETYDYGSWRPAAMWNPVPGNYTRYGDTRNLVRAVDDRFVIMGSGDELRLRLEEAALPPVAVGWTREFLLYVNGWSKDADPNTAYSDSVEPLPFHAMSSYPYPPSERFPDDEAHRTWRAQYNTRPAVRLMPPLRAEPYQAATVSQRTRTQPANVSPPVPRFLYTEALRYDASASLSGSERFPSGARLMLHSGSADRPLVPEFAASADADVSFDGTRILFSGKRRAGDRWQVWEASVAGGPARQVSSGSGDCLRPLHAPEGRLVYARRTASSTLIELAPLAGGPALVLTRNPGHSLPDAFLRDGRLVYEAPHPAPGSGSRDLYAVYTDGSGVETIRCDHGQDRHSAAQVASGDLVFQTGTRLAGFTSATAVQVDLPLPPGEYIGPVAETSLGEWLAGYRADASADFGIYLVRPSASKTPLPLVRAHAYQPVILAPRAAPPRHPSALGDGPGATLLCLNAYTSKTISIALGTIAAVRVWSKTAEGETALGRAPVEADGSFYVQVPADRPLRFELLDRRDRTVAAEAGWFWARKGEQRACVGCHAGPERAPDNAVPQVLERTQTPVPLGLAGRP